MRITSFYTLDSFTYLFSSVASGRGSQENEQDNPERYKKVSMIGIEKESGITTAYCGALLSYVEGERPEVSMRQERSRLSQSGDSY